MNNSNIEDLANSVESTDKENGPEPVSNLEKLCLETIRSGNISAFIDLFRLTHMEEPLGQNEPQSFEDLVATAGNEAAELAPNFAFDNPLQMPYIALEKLKVSLEEQDSAGLKRNLFEKYQSLSGISDMFMKNHKLREEVKMLPLVVPFPVYTDLEKTKENRLLSLIDLPDFRRAVESEDPIIATVAKLRGQELDHHVYPPVVIHYALQARNVLFEYILQTCKNKYSQDLFDLMPDADIPEEEFAGSSDTVLSKDELVRLALLLMSCYLRLARALNEFQLYRAAGAVFDLFLSCVKLIEEERGISFAEEFVPTETNGYAVILTDDHENLNGNKKDDNLSYANLELGSIPHLQDTILEYLDIPATWALGPADTALEQGNGIENDMQTLAEVVYAGRELAVLNIIQLGCGIATQAITTLSDISVESGDLVERLADREVPADVFASKEGLIISIALLRRATQVALQSGLYSVILPAFKRFAEIISKVELFDLGFEPAEQLQQLGDIFAVNSLAWRARWARQRGDDELRKQLLQQRCDYSKQMMGQKLESSQLLSASQKLSKTGENALNSSGGAKNNQAEIQAAKALLSTKYAVTAATELTFNSGQKSVAMMAQAWSDLQNVYAQSQSQGESQGGGVLNEQKRGLDNAMIEARVRYGAVKGQENVDALFDRQKDGTAIQEGHDEDLDDVVINDTK